MGIIVVDVVVRNKKAGSVALAVSADNVPIATEPIVTDTSLKPSCQLGGLKPLTLD